jgi:glycosyltransferase 2 family protein
MTDITRETPSPADPEKARSVFRSRPVLVGLVVGIPLSAAFLWLALRGADPAVVRATLAEADLALMALAVAAVGAFYMGQALRWRRVARAPAAVPRARFLEMVLSSVAVNIVLPGRVGELLRIRWLQVAAHWRLGRSVATVFVDRAFDVLALVIFLAISLPSVASAEWLRWITASGLLLLLAIGLVLVAARVYTGRRARERRLDRSWFRRIARDTLEGLAEPIGRVRAVVLVGMSLGTWTMWAIAAMLVARAVGVELSISEAVFVTAVLNLGVAIPSAPGFIGTFQWLGVAALGVIGVGTDQALAFAILMHAVWYVPTLLVGGALLLRRGLGTVRNLASSGLDAEVARDA